jgi:hypothetical protein
MDMPLLPEKGDDFLRRRAGRDVAGVQDQVSLAIQGGPLGQQPGDNLFPVGTRKQRAGASPARRSIMA